MAQWHSFCCDDLRYDEKLAPMIETAYAAAKQTEVARALLSVSTKFSDLKAAAYAEWIALDTNGDQHVSFEEFRVGVQKRLADQWTPEMVPVLRKVRAGQMSGAPPPRPVVHG